MLKRLKECKTIKEIYQVLGDKPFEWGAAILLLAWILQPVAAGIGQISVALNSDYSLGRDFLVASDYQHNIQSVGIITLEFAALYLLGRFILYKDRLWKKLKSEPWHIFFFCMLFWCGISTILSDNPSRSFWGSEMRFEGLLTYFFYAGVYITAMIVVKSSMRRKLLWVFSLVGNIVSAIVILQDLKIGIWHEIYYRKLSAMFFQYNHTAYFINMAIVCSFGMYLFSECRKIRLWYLLSMIFQIYAILVNSTFGCFLASWCALAMLLVFFVRFYGKFSVRMLMPVLVVIAVSTASYFGLVKSSSGEDMRYNIDTLAADVEDIASNDENIYVVEERVGPGHGRMGLWRQGLKMIPKRPVFGYGPEMLDEELAKDMWVDRPDNEFIQHAIFMGIPGLVFYLMALLSMFIKQWSRMKRLDTTTIVAAGCVIAYLASSMFGNSMFYTTPYLYMFLSLASLSPKKEE